MAVFTGAGVAIIIPIKEDLEVDYEKLAEILDIRIPAGRFSHHGISE